MDSTKSFNKLDSRFSASISEKLSANDPGKSLVFSLIYLSGMYANYPK